MGTAYLSWATYTPLAVLASREDDDGAGYSAYRRKKQSCTYVADRKSHPTFSVPKDSLRAHERTHTDKHALTHTPTTIESACAWTITLDDPLGGTQKRVRNDETC